ncbi:helix-turn-helix domain-containing protein [Rhodopseudomonas sp. P2A-2r]|uniref:helix-turn-helix domain-containing protein n=1 Tax=Rhodopseudomonas sp. P2A-2r TaxID=2991972 RepID=UPI00223418D8|nr:helix-turn-helix domain-containing protein [Rhodopseudomonas sp. P2A-2r]UZE51881.1 helix-turn-helix domain-containing protein [Rhodopseudomonas sp. P2A-2r]
MSRTIVMETADNPCYRLIGMQPGEIIKEAREKRNWSQKELGDQVGISQPAIKKIEAGETSHSKFLPKIAQVLDLDLATLDISLSPPRVQSEMDRPFVTEGRPDFPVYSSAEGGPGELIRSTDPVEFIPRPSHLVHVRDAYGLLVTGSSMAPEYKSGETATVEPHLPIVPDEVYIFYAERDGEARATIKHLRRATSDKWLVTQHNPPEGKSKDFALSRSEWGTAHRVTGKRTRR